MAKESTFQGLSLGFTDFTTMLQITGFTVDDDGTWTEYAQIHRQNFYASGQLTENELKELNKLYNKVEKKVLTEPMIKDSGFEVQYSSLSSDIGTLYSGNYMEGEGEYHYYYDPKVVDPLKDYLLSLDAKYGLPLFF